MILNDVGVSKRLSASEQPSFRPAYMLDHPPHPRAGYATTTEDLHRLSGSILRRARARHLQKGDLPTVEDRVSQNLSSDLL